MALTLPSLLRRARVLPVVTLDRAEQAIPAAEALAQGGVSAVEITLRTEAGIDAIREVRKALPRLVVGAGTILNADQLERAVEAGAQFGVSPGFSERLSKAAAAARLPFLPGVSSATDVLRAMEKGFSLFKLFPAGQLGGVAMLRALAGPFPDARFVPSGGLTRYDLMPYLEEPNVLCVSGSWLAPPEAVAEAQWFELTEVAKEALERANADAEPFVE